MTGQPAVPVAMYLRMSTEHQRYSLANQAQVISKYAQRWGFEITKTYEDRARSGLSLKRRDGLSRLLHDVTAGDCPFSAILVFDITRWGRFPDSDEAAHYEFLCKSAGVPIHYCAEPFRNDNRAVNLLLKNVKRIMASEYSIDLSNRVEAGMVRLARMGYHMGSTPKLGFRRMLISTDSSRSRLLQDGEQKVVSTDRVVLVPGPEKERDLVRKIFRMALTKNCVEIAHALNRRGILNGRGNPWTEEYVRMILICPLYVGCAVWGTTTQKLRSKSKGRKDWLVPIDRAARLRGQPIIDRQMFDRVQALIKSRSRHTTDEELVARAREVLRVEGRLTAHLLQKHGFGGGTVERHFGTYDKFFRVVGYQQSPEVRVAVEHYRSSKALRKHLAIRIAQLWPGRSAVKQTNLRTTLALDDVPVCIATCRYRPRPSGKGQWHFSPVDNHRHMLTLLVPLNSENNGFRAFYLFPPNALVKYSGSFGEKSRWLEHGRRLEFLTQLFEEVRRLSAGTVLTHVSTVQPE